MEDCVMEKLHKIIQLIITRINTPAFVEKHKTNSTDFTRKKKIGFTDTFLFVMTLVKTCLDFDLVHFSKVFEIPKVYPSAITQRRAQIQYTAFEEIFERTAEEIPSDKMFEGYRIIAFDGMTGELPRTPELIGEYGLVGGSFYPQFHAVAAYDVLNGYFLYADWTKKAISDERQSVISLVQSKTFPEKSIFVLDRGFVGTKLIHTLLKHEHKFVIRSTNSTFSEIQKFMSSDLTESNVGITITKKRANWNKMNTFEIEMPFTFELRCVKVELDSGEVETLLTNLTAAEMTANKMKELYWLRWGIETSFNYLKNAINIETFIGIKDNSLKQEFYAGLTVYNLVKIMTSQAQGVYDSKKNDKAHV
jgi:hypothetical protein